MRDTGAPAPVAIDHPVPVNRISAFALFVAPKKELLQDWAHTATQLTRSERRRRGTAALAVLF